VRAWRRDARDGSFPEDVRLARRARCSLHTRSPAHAATSSQSLPELADLPPTGIAFSGGGSRGYVAALAQLGALQSLGLLQHVRCVTAVSGGGWAASAYTFYRPGSSSDGAEASAPRDDAELFGESYEARPEAQTREHLDVLPPRCARGAVCRLAMVDEVVREVQAGRSPTEAWTRALHKTVLAPLGVPRDAPWSWSEATAAESASRNPGLLPGDPAEWVLPARRDAEGQPLARRPFLVLGLTLLGPVQLVPHRPLRLRSYTLLEVTPLYCGVARTLNVRYTSSSLPGARARHQRHLVGGFLEPFGFGARVAAGGPGALPQEALPKGEHCGLLTIPLRPQPEQGDAAPRWRSGFTLAQAAAASSFAPGGLLASQLPGRRLAARLGWTAPYFSPAAQPAERAHSPGLPLTPPPPPEMLLADGGCLTNPAVHPLLQRGLTRLVVFLNFQTPMAPRSAWDPRLRPPTGADCSEELPALFGCTLDTGAWSFLHNAVFPAADLARLVCALQDADAGGRGAVVTLEHVTVANSWWGIPAGRRVTVTWCYLGAAAEWAARLPAETAAKIRPPVASPERGGEKADALLTPAFPHYGTLDLSLAPRQVNLLHSLCDWTVREHAAELREVLLPRKGDRTGGQAPRPPREEQSTSFTKSARMLLSQSAGTATSRVAAAGRLGARLIAGVLLSMMPGGRRGSPAEVVEAAVENAPPEEKEEAAALEQEASLAVAAAEPRRGPLEAALRIVRNVLPSG